MNSVEEALLVRRTYRHPRELVFRAWTEAERLAKWFKPSPQHRTEAQVDLKVGGRYRIAMHRPDGGESIVGGVYRTVEAPAQLAFTWMWQSSEAGEESFVTVTFNEIEVGTEVVVLHEGLPSEESREAHSEGWNGGLDNLGNYLGDSMMNQGPVVVDVHAAAVRIAQAKELAAMSMSRLQDTFAHVPDVKLDWTPYDTAKSPLAIAAHCGYCNRYFASVLRGDPPRHENVHDVLAEVHELTKSITTREQAASLLGETTTELGAAFDSVDPSRLATDPRLLFFLTLVGRHNDGHAAQIDYLQTCWGDLEDHFGM